MKKVVFIIISCLLFLSGVLFSNLFKEYFKNDVIVKINREDQSLSGEKYDLIIKKETALKIGQAVLEEYSEKHWKRPFEYTLDAIEKDHIWRVYSIMDRQYTSKGGQQTLLLGGEVYVEISKRNGEILKIGVEE